MIHRLNMQQIVREAGREREGRERGGERERVSERASERNIERGRENTFNSPDVRQIAHPALAANDYV